MKQFLENVPQENYFKLCLGIELRSLEELEVALESMSDKTFSYHVNDDKNDFKAWIQDVIKDEKLSVDVEKIKTRDQYLEAVKKRIEEIKKSIKPENFTADSGAQGTVFAETSHSHYSLKDFLVGLLLGIVIGLILGASLKGLAG